MFTHVRRPALLLLLIAMFSMVASSAVYAQSKSAAAQTHPNSITVSTAVTMIVHGLNLNIDDIRFIKEPKASDYYTKVKDTAPYAGDFIIAQFNGLELPKDIDPNAYVTREQFAKWLFGGLSSTGEYMWIDLFVDIKDANKVSKGYMESIQKLLIAGIASTDSYKWFWPKMDVTKAQAERMVKKAAAFVEKNHPAPNPETGILTDVKLNVAAYADGVDRVTVSAQAPHPGYGIDIASVQFMKGAAVVSYRVVQPDPEKMYAQVITEVKAYAYIPAGTKAILGDQAPSEVR